MDRGERPTGRRFDTSRPGESFVEVVRGVLVEPARFFAGLGGPRPDRVKGPLLFAVICGMISLPLALIVEPYDPLASGQPGLRSGFYSLFRDNPVAAIALAAVFVVLLPLLVVLGVYVGAALALFSWIPILGYLVNLYGVYITMVGLRELHGTSTTRALLAALVPTLLSLAAVIPALIYSLPNT